VLPFDGALATGVALAAASLWLVFVGVAVRSGWTRRLLGPDAATHAVEPLPSLTMLVAARNETDCIEACIRSILAQDYPGLRVVAVNDRSSDDTGAILDRLAAEFPGRVVPVHLTQLPAGWFGKPHALHLGMKRVQSELVCFTDADCRFASPVALRATVANLVERKLDLLSLTPQYLMPNAWEQATVPCCSELMLSWYRPERANDPESSVAFANGAFILAKRESLEGLGGWGVVAERICEDLQLAKIAKRAGLSMGMENSSGLLRTRTYSRARDSWNGWSRIFTGGLTTREMVLSLARMSVMFALPLVATWVGLGELALHGTTTQLASVAGMTFGLCVALRTAVDVAMFRMVGASAWFVPLAPLGRLFVMAALTRALLSQLGLAKTTWRGAAFVGGKMVRPQPATIPAPHWSRAVQTRSLPAEQDGDRRPVSAGSS
jgi:cellulose synthase/poly-beta-1,6-N-acetylglucosamine synthase-like glycosyltransferase